MPQILAAFNKGDDEVLDFVIDWQYLLAGDTIDTSDWVVPTGLTKDSDSDTTTTTTVWLSGGTAGTQYDIENTIVTVGLRTHVRTLSIVVVDR